MTPWKWDYTKWSTYAQCPYKYAATYVWRYPQGPAHPALLKGRRAHTAVENIIKHGAEDVYGVHPKAMLAVRHVIAQEDKIIESKLTFNRTWQMVKNGVPEVWLTVKMDAVYQIPEYVHPIDWKTGKTRANAYGEQLDLYRLVSAIMWPSPLYMSSIVNVDDGKITDGDPLTREQALASRDKWTERATTMETDTVFEPKPNEYCFNCPFGNSKGGRCRYG